MTNDGWLNLQTLIVPSDGRRSPGGDTRKSRDDWDRGSMLAFFDPQKGKNTTGELYWWDGKRIVDSSGSPVNAAGNAYGDNPLMPNEAAIKAFAYPFRDMRLQNSWGYPDWFLLRRGRVHETFEISLNDGRSRAKLMVVAAYGPSADGRATMAPEGRVLRVPETKTAGILLGAGREIRVE